MRYLLLVALSVLCVTALVPGGAVRSASEADAVIGECQKRTNMGRSSCIEFIKKYMSIERCQQYTKLSAVECQKKLEEIRKSPEFQSGGTPPPPTQTTPPSGTPSAQPPSLSPVPSGGTSLQERVFEAKRDREGRFLLIEAETEKVIAFLKERGGEVTPLMERLALFRQKKAAVLSAYDQYADLAAVPLADRPPLEVPRRLVGQVLREAGMYYRSSVLPELRRSLSQLDQSPV